VQDLLRNGIQPFQSFFIKPDMLNCRGNLASKFLVHAAVLCNNTSPTAAELKDMIKYSPCGLITDKNIHTCRPCIYSEIPLI